MHLKLNMNKTEQKFCTKLSVWLRTTNFEKSMLCEVKAVAKGDTFKLSSIRKSQYGTLNKLFHGLPVAHKISDSSIGSKLVDLIYISHKNTKLHPYVAIYFVESKKAYLVPYEVVDFFKINSYKSIPTTALKMHEIKW